MIGTFIRGVAGLGKAAVGADPVSEQVLAERQEGCRVCEQATGKVMTRIEGFEVLSVGSRCRKCQCLISAKTRVGSERCPLGVW